MKLFFFALVGGLLCLSSCATPRQGIDLRSASSIARELARMADPFHISANLFGQDSTPTNEIVEEMIVAPQIPLVEDSGEIGGEISPQNVLPLQSFQEDPVSHSFLQDCLVCSCLKQLFGLVANETVFWILLCLVFFVSCWMMVEATTPQIKIWYTRTPKNMAILDNCPCLVHGFRPALPLLNGNVQTGSVLMREGPLVIYDREILETGDGGCISLDWISRTSNDTCPHLPGSARERQAILVILHGLTGGSQESYVRALGDYAVRCGGMRAVVINNRGCAGSTLKTPQAYSAAWTADVRQAFTHIKDRWTEAPLFAAGFSLGANILAKYIGEEGRKTPLMGACVISNPYDLMGSNKMMHIGFGPLYDRVLCQGLIRTFKTHEDVLARRADLPVWTRVSASQTVLEFDDRHTRRVFGYESVEHYYKDGSSRNYAGNIAIPVLLLVAEDDHLLDVEGMQLHTLAEANPNVIVGMTRRGGHVAWHERLHARSEQWADRATVEFFASVQRVVMRLG